jgi:hypothetical protein
MSTVDASLGVIRLFCLVTSGEVEMPIKYLDYDTCSMDQPSCCRMVNIPLFFLNAHGILLNSISNTGEVLVLCRGKARSK